MNRKQFFRQTLVLFCLFQFSFFNFNAKAQVTIGADKEPENFSLLEVTGTTGGLRLPQLTTAQRDVLAVSGKELAKGLTIFNTESNCLEIWNGTSWLSNCGENIATQSPTIVIEPQSIRLTKDYWNTSVALNVTATGAKLNYQWFGWDDMVNDYVAIANATDATYIPTVGYLSVKYYCKVFNDNGIVETKKVSVLKVCDAKGDNNQTFYFMCHNLGADYTADPFIPAAEIHGAKYKWGVSTPVLNQVTDQTDSGSITNWTTIVVPPSTVVWDMATQNPCPEGWRVPTIDEWVQIVKPENNTIANVNDGSWIAGDDNYNTGITIGKNLFLPAVGLRNYSNGELNNRGNSGNYWSSTQYDTANSNQLSIYRLKALTGYSDKSFGFAIRCVAE
ncbi:hypothetical protein D0T49_06590 [Paludibacter sp. 221]|uniref:FISUMP domain-containing protein n=1 Tax=Paludibacter sp. 221 TaxID=2302939 RepID=UPI0013D1F2C4|nr:FISUMP domain-containing protein [Paludibacter sp. 221]NDV46712.1 hypothetical protein [Paludibacter sp. 221]